MIDINTPVDYVDATHTYTAKGQRYTSASQLYEKFKEKFPDDAHIKYAEKHGNTPEYWKAKWELKNEKSRERGDNIHANEELIDRSRMIMPYNGRTLTVHDGNIEEGIPWIQRPDGVYLERKLWHHGYSIAGRADKVIITSEFQPNTYDKGLTKIRLAHLQDYKTNEKLDLQSWCNPRTGRHKMMLGPIAYLMDCNWIHYCLQLSTYMFMLEYQGFTPGKMEIIWFPHVTEAEPNPKKQIFDVPYMKKEVIAMCMFINKS